jgi:preprotein translocase subunit SecB
MSNSPLRLERYYFTRIEIEQVKDGHRSNTNIVKTMIEAAHNAQNELQYMVRLQVFLESESGKMAPYRGEIDITGFFSVNDQFPKEQRNDLVVVNGGSLLFAAVREMVANLTSRGPSGMLTLQTIRFIPEKKGNLKEKEPIPEGAS